MQLSPEQIVAQLTQSEDFATFNTTTVGFLLYSCMGMDGPEAKQVALNELGKFVEWLRTQPPCYVPSTGVEPMLHPDVLADMHAWCTQFTNPDALSNDQLATLLGTKLAVFKPRHWGWGWVWGCRSLELGLGLAAVALALAPGNAATSSSC